jgi:hypothetical protein
MRMRNDDEVEGADIEIQRCRVLVVGIAAALEHAALDKEPRATGSHAIAGPGDLAGRAEESDFNPGLLHHAAECSSFVPRPAGHSLIRRT